MDAQGMRRAPRGPLLLALVAAGIGLLQGSVGAPAFVCSPRPLILQQHTSEERSDPPLRLLVGMPSLARGPLAGEPSKGLASEPRAVNRRGVLMMEDGGNALLAWAQGKGAFVSPKVSFRGKESARSVIAVERIDSNEKIFAVPTSLALSAQAAREQVLSLAGPAGSQGLVGAREDEVLSLAGPESQGLVGAREDGAREDAWLALWTALALRGLLPDCGWQVYAEGLRNQIPDLPALWDDNSIQLFSNQIRPRVLGMRREMQECVELCRDILQGLSRAAGDENGGREVFPGDTELQSAWALVRSRWIRESDTSSGLVSKKLFPVVDFMNHEPSTPSGAAAVSYLSEVPQARLNKGAAVKVVYEDDEAVFRTTRPVDVGDEITWTYGRLSNEDLLMVYGFVPAGFVHGDNRLGFSLPSELFRRSLDALSHKQGCSADLMERKVSLLEQLGVTTSTGGLLDLKFEAFMGEEPKLMRDTGLPVALSIIGRIMCLTTADELALVCLATAGETAAIDPLNEVRAMRWLAWLLTQIEEQMFAKDIGAVDVVGLGATRPASVQQARQISVSKVMQGEFLVLKCALDLYNGKEALAQKLTKETKSKAKKASSKAAQNKPRGFGK